MTTPTGLDFILKQVRQRAAAEGSDASDHELLRRFTERGEEFALEALVGRHGPMVLGVCRRILGNETDAEDAFQATFLVLARKAPTLGRLHSLAAWLHTVANRLALRARAAIARRRAMVPPAVRPGHDPLTEMTARELCSALDEELNRLPEKYRLPLLLCCLEGKTRDEAARELGWSLGALKGRLERGRELLRTRLERRGVCLSTVLLHAGLTSAPLSARLVSQTGQAAASFLASGGVGSISVPVLELTSCTLGGAGMVRMGVSIVLLAAMALAAGATALSRTAPKQAQTPPAAPVKAAEGTGQRNAEPAVDKYGDPLPQGAQARLGGLRLRAAGELMVLAYSPDGKLLATGGLDSAIRLWDTKTGKLVRVLNRGSPENYTNVVLFSKDSSILMACNQLSPTTRRWEVATGRELPAWEWQEPGAKCVSAALSPDGKVFASGSSDGTIRLRDTATGRQLTRLDWHKGAVSGVAFSPDGTHLVSCSNKGGPVYVGPSDGKTAPRPFQGDRIDYQWHSVCFSPDGKQIVTTGWRKVPLDKDKLRPQGVVHCWDVESGKIVRDLLPDPDAPVGGLVAYSPDGKIIVCGSGDRSVRVWEAATGKLLLSRGKTMDSISALGNCVTFAPDGKTLAVAKGNRVDLWDVVSGQSQLANDSHDEGIDSLAFSGMGNVLGSKQHNGGLRLWNAGSGKMVQSLPETSTWGPVAISADGKVVACGSGLGSPDAMVFLWDVASGRILREFSEGRKPNSWATCLAFSADSKLLAAGSFTEKPTPWPAPVLVWEVATGKLVRQLDGLETQYVGGTIMALAFSRDTKEVMAGTQGPTPEVCRWELRSGKQLSKTALPGTYLKSLVFTSDGTFAACDFWNDSPQIHFQPMTQNGEACSLDVITPHRSFAVSPDGRFFATGTSVEGFEPKAYARGVRVWELASGKEVCHFNPGAAVTSIAFSGDGKTLATGQTDTTILLWNLVPPSDKSRAPADLWADLGAEDPGRAYRAVADLVSMPREAVTLLKAHLHQVRAADLKLTDKFIAELGSEDFTLREKASKELENLEERAQAALGKALQDNPDLEVKVRLEKLLKRLGLPTASTRRLRDLRAVLVLEKVNSPEARQLLRELSKGDPKALLTREAAAALHRARN